MRSVVLTTFITYCMVSGCSKDKFTVIQPTPTYPNTTSLQVAYKVTSSASKEEVVISHPALTGNLTYFSADSIYMQILGTEDFDSPPFTWHGKLDSAGIWHSLYYEKIIQIVNDSLYYSYLKKNYEPVYFTTPKGLTRSSCHMVLECNQIVFHFNYKQ